VDRIKLNAYAFGSVEIHVLVVIAIYAISLKKLKYFPIFKT
jgi:hypothetical protein